MVTLIVTSIGLLVVSLFLLRLDPPLGAETEFRKPVKAWQVVLGISGVALIVGSGLLLNLRIGVRALFLAGSASEQSINPWGVIGHGLFWGVLIAVVFEVLSRVLFRKFLTEWTEPCQFRKWRTYLGAAIGAGVSEELIYRLFLFPLFAWLVGLLWHTADGLPTQGAMWFSLVVVAVIFGSTHLPVLTDMGGFTPSNVAKGLALFSSAGLLLGYVFWTSGIEVAMVAHASALLFGWLYWSAVKAVTGDGVDQSQPRRRV